MYLEKAFLLHNKFSKYAAGISVIVLAAILGQFIMVIAFKIDAMFTGAKFPVTEKEMMTYFSNNTTLFFVLLPFAFALGALMLMVKNSHRQTLVSLTTSRNKIDWKRIMFSFTLWSVFTAGSTIMFYFMSPEDFVFNFKPVPFLILAILGIVLIPIQTSAEEYVFRGYLMQGFALLSKNRWFPLVVTSVFFGLLHIANPEVGKMGNIILVYYIGTGFFLGIITLMDEGMELALGFHAANNLVGALLVTSDWSAFQTDSVFKDISTPTAGADVLLPVLVIYPIVLFVFSKKYHWNNWLEKLTGKIKIKAENNFQNIENHE